MATSSRSHNPKPTETVKTVPYSLEPYIIRRHRQDAGVSSPPLLIHAVDQIIPGTTRHTGFQPYTNYGISGNHVVGLCKIVGIEAGRKVTIQITVRPSGRAFFNRSNDNCVCSVNPDTHRQAHRCQEVLLLQNGRASGAAAERVITTNAPRNTT